MARNDEAREHVILLHGLARTAASMLAMEQVLKRAGYEVHNLGYPSRAHTIDELAEQVLPPAYEACEGERVHFVTHSMGGILLRAWAAQAHPSRIGNTVMLAPPNKGSKLVDVFADLPLFDTFNGRAGTQLGTNERGLPASLPPVDFPVGIIAGDMSINPITNAVIGEANDGKVAVDATRVEGMTDHLTLPVTHTFLMNNPIVMAQAIVFLRDRRFDHTMKLSDAVGVLAGLARSL